MKLVIFSLFSMLTIFSCDVGKRTSTKAGNNVSKTETAPREEVAPDFSIQKASYMYHKGGIRTVGNVYSFIIQTHQEDVSVDSVWFGGLPVACDVYDNGTQLGHKGAMEREGQYLIKANKNLYRNFYPNIDSTEVAESFVPPIKFQGEAIIFYNQYGIRKYKIVEDAEYLGKKTYR